MLKLILTLTLGVGHAHDFFSISCDKYLIQPDPKVLERETTEDLTFLAQVLKARVYLYAHPNDSIWLRFLETELTLRSIIENDPL